MIFMSLSRIARPFTYRYAWEVKGLATRRLIHECDKQHAFHEGIAPRTRFC